jgi:diguanylate cyclase (GGDEF)-like protein
MRKILRIPRNDPAQAVRARHTLIAGGSYLVIISFVMYCSYAGLFRLSPMATAVAALFAFGINMLFYAAICSGWNQRLRDPSMTLQQLNVSILWLMFVLYFISNELRGAVLILFLNNFVFGIFRLRTMQFLVTSLFALFGYGCVIALLMVYRPQPIDVQLEALQWVLLAMVLPWFALVGAYISNIRGALRQKNKALERALETIERLASHDELTGIYTRRFFLDAMRREKIRCERAQQPFCVALLDLDSFKAVNDTHGHQAGDDVLRAFTDCVQTELRQSDYFARYGGEEFALLLVDTDLELAAGTLERIRRHVESQVFPHVGQCVTVSAGVTEYRPGEELNDTIARADRALYAAKDGGRNRVELAAARGVSAVSA